MVERADIPLADRAAFWQRMARTALPIVAVLLFVSAIAAVLAVAGDTLGYDFLAYHQAAERLVHGQPLYDVSFEASGGFGLFYYPPMFAPLIVPFGFVAATTATWVWIGLLVAAFAAGVAILPVSRTVRWWILLAASLSWLLAYAIKLGQVGPFLFLLFAAGWRWLDEPVKLGSSAALGTAIKLQPGIVLVWAILTRRWTSVAAAIVVLAILSVAATLLAGFGAWADFARLVSQVADPIATPGNATPGAVAYRAGLSRDLALLIQWLATIAVVIAVLVAAFRATAEAAYLVAVVASQLLSPILWDHYAVLLLLPVAYLCAAGRWWTLVVPLATAAPLLGLGPPVIYSLAFAVVLVVTLWTGIQARRNESRASGSVGVAA